MLLETLFTVALTVGAWQSHGPELAYVSAMVVSAGDDRSLYAVGTGANAQTGSWESAAFRSMNGGGSWERLADAPLTTFFIELRGDPRNPGRLFAATVHAGFPNFMTRLYRSVDGGETWTLVQALLGPQSCSVAFDGDRPDTLYVAYGGQPHFFRSEDGGDSFVEHEAPFSGARLQIAPDGALLAVNTAGVFGSRDEGESWYVLVSPQATCPAITALAIDPTDPNRMFLGTGVPSVSCGVLRSTDGGKTWSPTAVVYGPVTDLAIDPVDPLLVYAATAPLGTMPPGGRVLFSADDGQTWRDLGLPVSAVANQLASSEDGRRLYAATSAGVYARDFRRPRRIAPRP
jgi:photosystem II stability/assembly factor-like uncharacterized protein